MPHTSRKIYAFKRRNHETFCKLTVTFLDNIILIVRDEEHILNFRWAESENFLDYYELLKVINEPQFVISDGHTSIIKACKKLWKNVGFQRCLVHVSRDAQRKLGKRSPHKVNHIFRHHIMKLPNIYILKDSKDWLEKFDSLYKKHKRFIEQQTPRVDLETGEIIGYYRTHKKLYSACYTIHKLRKKNMLFLHLENGIPNNSNCLEGGINSPLKNLLRCHRGISLERQKRMFEWYLLKRSNTPINSFINSIDFDFLYPKNGH